MIRTIEIEFYEPYTGIWVKGRNEYFFRDENDLARTVARWQEVLQEKFGDKAETRVL